MPVLHNRISNEELKMKMLAETEPRITVSFYKYFKITDPQEFRNQLYLTLNTLHVFGRIYIAEEGINGQVSIPENNYEAFIQSLYAAHPALDKIRLNRAIDDDGKSFWVLRMKVRNKIVADGIEDPDFDPAKTGKYLKAEEVNAMYEDDNAIFIDMRNHYEYEVGHFEKAIEIPSDTFKEQLPMAVEMLAEAKDKKIIMYCTGGIRCEKASAYFVHKGFENVFHIEGGIIEYVRQAKNKNLPLKFKGKNFVFDERLGERITDDVISECHQCGRKSDRHVNCKNEACHLLFIQCENCNQEFNGCCSSECKEVLMLPEEEQIKLRSGIDKGAMIFNKSKHHPLRQAQKKN